MRFVALLFLALAAGGWVLTQVPRDVPVESDPSPWRRTANGWENVEQWSHSNTTPYRIDPLLVAALQMCVCLAALFAAREARDSAATDIDATRMAPR